MATAPAGAAPGKIVFGQFCLDRGQGRLLARAVGEGGEAGRAAEPVPLTPKAFDLLAYLAERSGQLVTKNELLESLWGDAIVGDASIKVAVREIRKALADD